MYYYETKLVIVRDGKTKNEVYITQATDVIQAEMLTTEKVTPQRITGIVEKKIVDVFDNDDKSHFYECKVEFEDLDSGLITEVYLQKADSTRDAETSLLENLTGVPEFKQVKETKIVEFIN